MEAKLIKQGDSHYTLHIVGHSLGLIPSAVYPWDITKSRLSLKNCQAIERGYDLDELAINEIPYSSSTTLQVQRMRFIHGFQKALEILGDKKFSEEDIKKMMKSASYGWFEADFDKHLATLQQTEWDVIVEMECVIGCQNLILNGENSVCCGDKKPKISEDGCLILKRI